MFHSTCELVPLRHVCPGSQPSLQPRMEVDVDKSSLMDRIVHRMPCYFPDKRSHILSDKKNKTRTSSLLNLTPAFQSLFVPLLQL